MPIFFFKYIVHSCILITKIKGISSYWFGLFLFGERGMKVLSQRSFAFGSISTTSHRRRRASHVTLDIREQGMGISLLGVLSRWEPTKDAHWMGWMRAQQPR